MKTLILGLLILVSLPSFAGNPMDSSALAGSFTLLSTSSDYAKIYHCPEMLNIRVESYGVFLESTKGAYAHESFSGRDKDCDTIEGDIGPVKINCTRFNKNSVSESSTSPLTIVGFIREYVGIKLYGKNKNKLKFIHDTTQIPFGITGIWNRYDFSCKYRRASNL